MHGIIFVFNKDNMLTMVRQTDWAENRLGIQYERLVERVFQTVLVDARTTFSCLLSSDSKRLRIVVKNSVLF